MYLSGRRSRPEWVTLPISLKNGGRSYRNTTIMMTSMMMRMTARTLCGSRSTMAVTRMCLSSPMIYAQERKPIQMNRSRLSPRKKAAKKVRRATC